MGISYKRISPRILRAPCLQLPHQRQGSGSDSLSNHLMHAFQQRLQKSKIFLKGPPHKTGIFALFLDIAHARKDQERVPSWTWQSRLSLHRKTCRLEHKAQHTPWSPHEWWAKADDARFRPFSSCGKEGASNHPSRSPHHCGDGRWMLQLRLGNSECPIAEVPL